jgi:hypothetical protein
MAPTRCANVERHEDSNHILGLVGGKAIPYHLTSETIIMDVQNGGSGDHQDVVKRASGHP